ncbi:hypothetical protein U0039_06490 [Stenotrophomonas maltophilia]|jgi:hypothetical protein|uniref:hypothetical protein n=1 Tax=Stenotrophomonas TaxID=40323 RepID=UPI00046AB734|nr:MULTISPECIES: hypothetical protein [Stenotrophomonas]OMP38631.1 hypothetical protein BMR86_17075 [Stenotrophomonas sp. KAs 5-3]AIL06369.1 hypothetical protein DP16_1244 [Stenotrophomonas maltophilia]EKT4071027.1 hypothetical protein [Stenotrophomonas maltophilia]EKT4077879.1 hypothetical protein [Stenotrophomonas maltophilia]MBN5107709.1 hypothetical protein [Stenotrophomonas maltophilia]
MQPLILSLDPSLLNQFSNVTSQALADALADVLPHALGVLAADTSTSVNVPNRDLRGVPSGQVLTLQLATLDAFLDVQDAANG